MTVKRRLVTQKYGKSSPKINFMNAVSYKQSDKTGKLYKTYEMSEFKDFVKTMNYLYDAGIDMCITELQTKMDAALKK